MEAIRRYLAEAGDRATVEMINYISSLSLVRRDSPEVASRIVNELEDQRCSNLKLIASENFSSLSVQAAMANLLTDKYAEGYPYHRFYAGCDNIDAVEALAVEKAKELFGAEHAYVQPHSGADANLCAYWAILNQRVQVPTLEEMGITNPSELTRNDWNRIREACHNQRLLGLDYYSGGHLTHGYRQNVSAQMFDAYSYTVDEKTSLLDYDAIESMVKEVKPLILLAGYSAYPRRIDFRRMAKIAHDNGAVFMVDMAHFAGLVAGKVFTDEYDPVQWADVVTTTTHKTLRGPRGGLVLCKEEFRESVDKGCPLVIGGPLGHVIAAKALCFIEALKPEFRKYARRIVENAQDLALALREEGCVILTGGTDNHLHAPGCLPIRSQRPSGREPDEGMWHNAQQERTAIRQERSMVHLGSKAGHSCSHDTWNGREGDEGDRIHHRHGAEERPPGNPHQGGEGRSAEPKQGQGPQGGHG